MGASGRVASPGAPAQCNKFNARVAPPWQPMFERSDHVMTVATQRAMIAVMKKDDVAL